MSRDSMGRDYVMSCDYGERLLSCDSMGRDHVMSCDSMGRDHVMSCDSMGDSLISCPAVHAPGWKRLVWLDLNFLCLR